MYKRIIILLILAGLFAWIGVAARQNGFLHFLDIKTNAFFLAHRTSLGNGIMLLITTLLGPYFLTAIALLIAGLLLHHQRYRALATLIASLSVGPISWWIIKAITAVSRPPVGGLVTADGMSFPSGHAGYATVFFGWLILNDIFKKRSQLMHVLIILLGMTAVFFAGISRIYLSVHWLSDVLGGILLGLFWALFFDTALQHPEKAFSS